MGLESWFGGESLVPKFDGAAIIGDGLRHDDANM